MQERDSLIQQLKQSPNWKAELELIERLLLSGVKVTHLARELGTDYFGVYRTIRKHRLRMSPRCGKKVPAEQLREVKRLLLSSNMGPYEIASQAGLQSSFAVYRIRDELLNAALKDSGEFKPKPNKSQANKCPEHGAVSVWPCVACAALRHKEVFQAAKRRERRGKP